MIPPVAGCGQRLFHRDRVLITLDQLAHLWNVDPLSQQKNDLGGLIWIELDAYLHCRTRVEAGSGSIGKRLALESGRPRHRSVASQKLISVGCKAGGRWCARGERDPPVEVRMVGIASQQGSALGIPVGNAVGLGFLAVGT